MAASTRVKVQYEAEVADILAKLKQVEGVTAAEFRAMAKDVKKAMKDTTTSTERQAKQAARAAERQAKQAARAAERASREMVGNFKKHGELIQGQLGGIIGRLGTAGELMLAMGPAGAVGIALAGGTLLIGGLGVAAYKAADAVYEIVGSAVELKEEMIDLNTLAGGGLISDSAIAALDDAELSMATLANSTKLMKTEVGAGLAPAVSAVTPLIVAMNRALEVGAEQTPKVVSGWETIIGTISEFADTSVGKRLLPSVYNVNEALRLNEGRLVALEMATAAQAKQEEGAAIVKEALARVERDKAQAAKDSAQAIRDQARAERELAAVEAQRARDWAAWNEWQLRQLEASNEETARAEAEVERIKADARAEELRGAEELSAILAGLEEQRIAGIKQREQAERDAAREAAYQWGEAFNSMMHLSNTLLDNRVSNINTETTRGKEQAETLFRVQKGLAIGTSLANAAAAIVRQYKDLPLYAAIPASLVVGAATAAEISTIASTEMSYHTGGLLSPNTPLAPDERYRSTRGEQTVGVMTPQGLNAANRGESVGTTIRVQQVYQHKVYSDITQDSLSMTSSPLHQAMRTTPRGRVGHRTRR